MKMVCGVDLVYLPRFIKSLQNGSTQFLQRVYQESELHRLQPEHLAGIFAAKEAIIKALSLPSDSWQLIRINYAQSGGPQAEIAQFDKTIETSSVSIAHDYQYVIAYFVAVLS